jgi:CubicO group peptidase (beta-lactamase class C family)
MKLKILPLVALLALAGLASEARPGKQRSNADQRPAAEPPAPAEFDPAAIDSYIAAFVEARGISGLSVVIARQGRSELAKGYGEASLSSGQPVTPATVFAIGSVTKQFTAACVLLLAQDGKLSVQDKVAKYYPALTRANDITLLDLMNHVSGYPDYYPLDFVDRRMAKPIEVDELIGQYASRPLDFEPGSQYSYSNTGYVILGRIVEKVSGESMGSFLSRRIFKPLGMTNSVYQPAIRGDGYAEGYTRFALGPLSPALPESDGWLAAAGGINSTALDLAKWDLALTGGKVLSADSYALMTTPRQLADGRIRDYGCGIGVSRKNGTLVLAHEGEVAGFQACNTVVPATQSAVIILSNCEEWTSVEDLQAALVNLVLTQVSHVPRVAGPGAAKAAADFLRQLQSGKVERSNLGEEYSFFLDGQRLKGAAARLGPFGVPAKVEVDRLAERGGMEVSQISFVFKTGKLGALMYRSPDGKIQEFLVRP